MHTVTVLLSTYNGEKYLKELLDSVLNQEDVDLRVLIRDDGSKDKTIEIIEHYDDSRISLYKGENLKSARSFLDLLKKAPSTEFYAYCDQDDVWYPFKLKRAIMSLAQVEQGKAALYMSTYDVVDENLNLIYKRDMEYNRPLTLENTIMFRSPSGCVMVMNNEMRKLVIKSNPHSIRMHDFWTLMIAEALDAVIICDDYATMKYRQHENNVVGTNTKIIKRLYRLVKSIICKPHERMLQAKSLLDEYHDLLAKDKLELLEKVTNYRKSYISRFKLASDKRFRWNFIYDVMFIISVILGVF